MQSAAAKRSTEMVIDALVVNSLLATLYQYWRSLKRTDGVPLKQAFNPIDLPGSVWPRIFMLDILDGPENYRVRLLGTYLVDAYSRDLTGHRLVESEMPGITASATWRMLPALVAKREAQYYFGPTNFKFGDMYKRIEQVLMPLADDRGDIRYAIGGIDFIEFCEAPKFGTSRRNSFVA